MFYFVTVELYSYSFRVEAPTVKRVRLRLELFSDCHKGIFKIITKYCKLSPYTDHLHNLHSCCFWNYIVIEGC